MNKPQRPEKSYQESLGYGENGYGIDKEAAKKFNETHTAAHSYDKGVDKKGLSPTATIATMAATAIGAGFAMNAIAPNTSAHSVKSPAPATARPQRAPETNSQFRFYPQAGSTAPSLGAELAPNNPGAQREIAGEVYGEALKAKDDPWYSLNPNVALTVKAIDVENIPDNIHVVPESESK